MTTLLLVRHARHDVVDRVLCGRMAGVRLSAAGREEAARLARRLARRATDVLFTSPQPRARETAQAIAAACGLEPRVNDALDEINFGAWTGRAFAELDPDPHWQAWNAHRAVMRPPGGEAMHEAQARLMGWVSTLPAAHPGRAVVAVSHADVIKGAILATLDLSLDLHDRVEVAPASVSTLALWPGGGRVRSLNEQPPEE
jgi:probable phosphoglycerate mutase